MIEFFDRFNKSSSLARLIADDSFLNPSKSSPRQFPSKSNTLICKVANNFTICSSS